MASELNRRLMTESAELADREQKLAEAEMVLKVAQRQNAARPARDTQFPPALTSHLFVRTVFRGVSGR